MPWAIGSYALHAMLVGLHTLAFFKSVRRMGTVPTAISKGAQQAGNFLFAHLFFCHTDANECMWRESSSQLETSGWRPVWDRLQKPIAFVLCCSGCVIYMVGRPPSAAVPIKMSGGRGGATLM